MKGVNYIYLFRHGQTTYNRDKKFTGWQDPPLTRLGKKHASIIAKKLKNKRFEIAFQSSLKRSKDTLKEVIKCHPECRKVITDERIRERNYGSLNGLSHEQFIKRFGNERFDKIHRDFKTRPPQGESFADVEKRVHSFIKDIIKIIKKDKINIAISAHGNSIRLFRKIIEKASIKETCSWTIPYDQVFTYKIKTVL
ncbi:histidine phosphatase family protein [Candidatus Pacearchaeota archaeon]|nr:histidine phosphatase family protein [Candidatus Pacearchaeota archaeon]